MVQGERTPLNISKTPGNEKEFPEPLTLQWRVIHNILYLIGGITFVIGSDCYFPTVSNFALGGWMFSIGSLGFFLADLFEWHKNNRVGCFQYKEFEKSYENVVGRHLESPLTFHGKLQRADVGLNFFMSFIGSTLYLVGSILYIPQINQSATGNVIFIYGSTVIYLSQSWKLFRGGKINEHDSNDTLWRITTFRTDWSGALVDFFAGIGGFFYFVGSIIMLPEYDTNTSVTHIGAQWYFAGGWCFLLSGLFMTLRYFVLTPRYPTENLDCVV